MVVRCEITLHWLTGFVYTTGSDGAKILLVCCQMLHHIERGIFSSPATNGRNSAVSFRQVVTAWVRSAYPKQGMCCLFYFLFCRLLHYPPVSPPGSVSQDTSFYRLYHTDSLFLQLPDGFDQWEDPEGGPRSKYWLFQLPLCFTIALTVVISLCLQAQLFHSHRSHKGETLCSTEGGKLLFLLLPLYFSEMFHHPLSVPFTFSPLSTLLNSLH